MPIPDAENASASQRKIHGYLLNPDHPKGGPKAAWFASLGYEREEWQILEKDLLAIALTCDQYGTERSVHGTKYLASGTLSRPGSRPAQVLTVWMVEGSEPPRFVTAYPHAS